MRSQSRRFYDLEGNNKSITKTAVSDNKWEINRGVLVRNNVCKETDGLSQHELRNSLDENMMIQRKGFKAQNKYSSIHGNISFREWKEIYCFYREIKVTDYTKKNTIQDTAQIPRYKQIITQNEEMCICQM